MNQVWQAVRRWGVMGLVVVLAACGGGGGSAGSPILGGGSSNVSDLVISVSPENIPNDGSESASVTVTAVDSNRVPVAGASVRVTADNAPLTSGSATTGADGTVSSTVQVGADKSSRIVTVTATSGSITRTRTFTIGSAATGPVASDLVLTLSASNIASSGSETVTATAVALDANRNVISGVPVAVTANQNAIVTPSGTVTSAVGILEAVIGIGSDRTNRTVTVTAVSGSLTRSASFNVGVTTTTAASDLILTLSSGTVNNTGGESVTATVTALDANRNVLPGVPVLMIANNNAVVTPAGSTTGSSGTLAAAIGIGSDTSERSITVTASAGALQRSATFQVASGTTSGQPTLQLTLTSGVVTASNPATVTATARDSRGLPLAGRVVTFSTVRNLGAFSAQTALTDSNGRAVVALYPAVGASSGADEAVAAVQAEGLDLQATQGFALSATTLTVSSFVSDVPSGGRLSAYGQANLNVALNGATAGTPVSLSISSTCVTKGKATLVPATTTTTNGTATFTYKDVGCGATDSADSLQVTIAGGTANASLSLPLQAPTVSSLAFVSATPQQIYLRGSGFEETSQVVFQVRDQAGNALPNQVVQLSTTTRAGGLTLDGVTDTDVNKVSKQSDSDGKVTVRINSGTVPTPVRVRAELALTPTNVVSTVSSNLSIAVGLPSQRNFSLSQGFRNIEGFNRDGTANTYQAIASDRVGNQVPAGTSINFVTEGGQVEAIKQVTLGSDGLTRATANFISADPRPADGRITVLAYVLGEESFLDVNGDNLWISTEAFQDLGNVFLSRDFVSDYDAVTDEFISLGLSGTSACSAVDPAKDPLGLLDLNASVPSVAAATCDATWGRAYVRRAIETVLSTSASRLFYGTTLPNSGKVQYPSSQCQRISVPTAPRLSAPISLYTVDGTTLYGLPVEGGTFRVQVADVNPNRYNPVAVGSIISVATTSGISASVVGGSPVPNTSEVSTATIAYTFDTAQSGVVSVTVTSPSGLATTSSVGVTTAGALTPCTP